MVPPCISGPCKFLNEYHLVTCKGFFIARKGGENMNSHERLEGNVGAEFAEGLRQASGYNETRRALSESGMTREVLDRTPPIGLNLVLLSEMAFILELSQELSGRKVSASILGLSNLEGVNDFARFLRGTLQADVGRINVVEIDDNMLRDVDELTLDSVSTHLRDARDTGFADASQDIVIRDHLGNCCPPQIDRAINRETARILKPGGIAIVNITTSELLSQSQGRIIIPFDERDPILKPLREEIYDLAQIKRDINQDSEHLRGSLIEIEPDSSFVIFGEDDIGHGEWFRTFSDHLENWKENGFSIIETRIREGNDSHTPPLRCLRHNVFLRKIQ